MNDITMMKDSDRWPQWPFLPVKHRHQRDPMPLCGVLFADTKPIVLEVNLFAMEGIEDVKRHSYPTFEALAEEWEVD